MNYKLRIIFYSDIKMMYSFETIKHDNENFKNYICRSIFKETHGLVKCDDFNKLILNENSYKNVFITESNEINILKINTNTYKFNIYSISKNKKYIVKFGCELETCILLNCISNSLADLKFKKLKSVSNMDKILDWKELVFMYIKEIILKDVSEDFLNKFPYIYISYDTKTGYSDYIIDARQKTIKDDKTVIHYDSLIFTMDNSVECGDKSYNKDKSFHCEIVCPIMTNTKDLSLLYLQLFNKNCFKSNDSTGFHVNISMMDKYNNPIYFSDTLIYTFLNDFEEYENTNYKLLRPNNSRFAKQILLHAQDYTYKNIRSIIKPNNIDYFYKNFIKGKKYYRSFIDLDYKEITLHLKNPILLELRLFPSKDDYLELLEYVETSIKLINHSLEEYLDKYILLSKELQQLNIENEVDYSPINYYEGYLYYKQGNEIKEVDEDLSDLETCLKDFFTIHNQTLISLTELFKRKFICQVIDDGDDIIKEYNISFNENEDNKVIINLVSHTT